MAPSKGSFSAASEDQILPNDRAARRTRVHTGNDSVGAPGADAETDAGTAGCPAARRRHRRQLRRASRRFRSRRSIEEHWQGRDNGNAHTPHVCRERRRHTAGVSRVEINCLDDVGDSSKPPEAHKSARRLRGWRNSSVLARACPATRVVSPMGREGDIAVPSTARQAERGAELLVRARYGRCSAMTQSCSPPSAAPRRKERTTCRRAGPPQGTGREGRMRLPAATRAEPRPTCAGGRSRFRFRGGRKRASVPSSSA